MAISKKILKYLEDKKYKFSLIDHKTAFTAWDKAQTEKANPRAVAKTLVMKADNDYLLALIPSDRNLDKGKLLKAVNTGRKKEKLKSAKKIDFAKEIWMKKNILGKVGATPPFAELLKLAVFVDGLLLKNKKIYLGSGEYTQSFLIGTAQYLKNEKPATGNFSTRKK
jgi:Ala-tRNA(Pro) deacylase